MRLKKENSVVTIFFERDLTGSNIDSGLPATFDEEIKGSSCIVLNFEGVAQVDAAGIRFLIYIYLFSKLNNNTNFVENATGQVKTVLEFLSMEKMFPIF